MSTQPGVSIYRTVGAEKLDALLAELQALGITAWELDAWDRAKSMAADAEESNLHLEEHDPRVTPWQEFRSQQEAEFDDWHATLCQQWDQVGEAMVVVYGSEP